MPWPIPQPAEIANRAAGIYTAQYPDFNPTQPNTLAGANCRIVAMTAFDLYGYQGYIAQELFPDTTVDNLDRHAGIWGLTRLTASAATGQAVGAGTNGTIVPSGTVATDPLGNSYFTTAAATVSGGAVTANWTASTAGAQGNLVAGTVLTLLSPIAGLSPQSFTVLGEASVAGASGTVVPASVPMLDPAGNAYVSGASVTLAGTSGTITFGATSPGGFSLAAGTVLSFSTSVSGLSPQSATVTLSGFAGGAPVESDTALRARLLARIRSRGRGGDGTDYQQWAEAASATVAAVQVAPCWGGVGNVGVWIAGNGPSALSGSIVTAVADYIASLAPVTATVIVNSAATDAVNATVHLVPDTTANRAAAQAAFAAWVQEAGLAAFDAVLARGVTTGGTLYVDSLDAAIAGGGSYQFDRSVPASDIVLNAGTVAVPGSLTFI